MKKPVLTISILLVVLAVFWSACLRPAKPIRVYGNLSAQDIADIRHVVKQDLARRIFPEFSWKSFKRFPANMGIYLKYKILDIKVLDPNNVAVAVQLTPPKLGTEMIPVYAMSKTNGGWKAGRIYASTPLWRQQIQAVAGTDWPPRKPILPFQSVPPPAKLVLPAPLASNTSLMSLTLDLPEDRRRQSRVRTYGAPLPAASVPSSNFITGTPRIIASGLSPNITPQIPPIFGPAASSNFIAQPIVPAPPLNITNFLPGH